METNDNDKASVIVEIIDGGPLKITGQILLKDQKKDISDNSVEVFLCRCGRSCNKPYCDGAHKN